MTIELKLPNCTVRSLRITDADSMAQHANDHRIWAQLRDRFPHPYSLADAHAWIDFTARQDPYSSLAILVDDHCIGTIGLERQPDVHRLAAELGYWIGVDYWGRGVATAAISAVTSWAFQTLDLQRIFAEPYADNIASCRALEKAGFTFEGTMRRGAIKDGTIRDQRMYAKVR